MQLFAPPGLWVVSVLLAVGSQTGPNLPPDMVGKERLKKEAGHSRLVGGKFNKQGNLHTRLVLGSHKTSRCLHPPTRILKVYVESLTVVNYIYYLDGLNNTILSQCFVLENRKPWEWWSGHTFQRQERGEEFLIAQVQLAGQLVVISSDDLLQPGIPCGLIPKRSHSPVVPTLLEKAPPQRPLALVVLRGLAFPPSWPGWWCYPPYLCYWVP